MTNSNKQTVYHTIYRLENVCREYDGTLSPLEAIEEFLSEAPIPSEEYEPGDVTGDNYFEVENSGTLQTYQLYSIYGVYLDTHQFFFDVAWAFSPTQALEEAAPETSSTLLIVAVIPGDCPSKLKTPGMLNEITEDDFIP